MPAHRFPFTDELANEICEWISEGKTLRAFCRQEGKPGYNTVYRWIDANPTFVDAEGAEHGFRDAMETARQVGADAIADETLEIIDTQPEFASSEKGSHRDGAHVAWMKNRVWHRMQLLAKWHPKRYGEKVTQEVTGKGGGPIETRELSDFEKNRRLAYLLDRALSAKSAESAPEDPGNAPQTTL